MPDLSLNSLERSGTASGKHVIQSQLLFPDHRRNSRLRLTPTSDGRTSDGDAQKKRFPGHHFSDELHRPSHD
jgi:hypothetical protein